ncbi:MAG: hypothetical protein E7660_00585 [Ruminococcaceae bacterium]|nr:hypothetical protein [Oscillospiraceae bacterium]
MINFGKGGKTVKKRTDGSGFIKTVKGCISKLGGFLKINKKTKVKKAEEESSIYCLPSTSMGRPGEIAGLVCRSLVAFASIFGMMFLLFEAVGIYEKNPDFRVFSLPLYVMLLFSLAAALLAGLASYNRITAAAVPVGTAGLVVLWATIASSGSPFSYLENSLRRLYNDVIEGISLRGYTGLSDMILSMKYGYQKDGLVVLACFIFALVMGLLMYFALLKKARFWLFALVNCAVALPMFLCNLPGSNLGFAMMAGAFAGFVAVWAADRRYSGFFERQFDKKQKRTSKNTDRKKARDEKRLERLKIKEAAQKIYDTAIEAKMGTTAASAAKRAVYIKIRQEKLSEKKASLDSARLAKKEARLERKKKKQIRKEEAAKKKLLLKNEKKLPKAERAAAAKARLDEKKTAKAQAAAAKAAARAERRQQRILEGLTARKNRAAGGFAGAVALLVALLAVWVPALLATKSFPIIEALNDEIGYIRALADDILMGDDVDLQSKWLYGEFEKFDYEELSFEPRIYEGTLIFKVESVRKDPIYLKSRVAKEFDFEKGEWTFAGSEDVLEYRNQFGSGFTPDSILTRAYTYLYPSSNVLPARHNYINFNRFGFTVQQIHLLRLNGDSRLLFTPSVLNTNFGILERDSHESGKYRWRSFYDGVYTSGFYGTESEGYSAASYVFNMKRNDMAEVLECQSETLELVKTYADRIKAGTNKEALLNEFKAEAAGLYLESDLGERALLEMSDEELESFKTFMMTEDRYSDYVNKTYLPDEEETENLAGEKISALAAEIESTAKGGAEGLRHDKVLAVISYLCSEEFTYNLEPAVPETESSVLEAFLFETKEGYCSHYATAATVLLREMGIPARFVEGYIANEWYDNFGTQQAAKFRSDVNDEDSHTWVEVYYENIGWIPYEVTKTFAIEMFGETESGVVIAPVIPEAPAEEEEEEEEMPLERPEDPEMPVNPLVQFKWLIISAGIFIVLYIAVSAVVRFIKKRAQKEIDKRYRAVLDAKNEDVYRDRSVDKRELARYINDCIFTIFEAVGIGPEKGELLSEFGIRLQREYGNLSTEDPVHVMACISKEEFGHGLSFTELSSVAEYLSDIMASVYSGLTPIQKLRLRYFRRII